MVSLLNGLVDEGSLPNTPSNSETTLIHFPSSITSYGSTWPFHRSPIKNILLQFIEIIRHFFLIGKLFLHWLRTTMSNREAMWASGITLLVCLSGHLARRQDVGMAAEHPGRLSSAGCNTERITAPAQASKTAPACCCVLASPFAPVL